MDYLKQDAPEKAFILDIETDSLTPTVVWCCVVKNLASGEVSVLETAEAFKKFHQPDHVYIGHNLLTFDVPVLNRLWDTGIDVNACVDTMVLSYLYNPGIDGGHSLATWGDRLGLPKGGFHDFSHYSEEMLRYCKQDTEVTYELYHQLTKKMLKLGYSELSAQIEHRIAVIIKKQQDTGCYFDTERATLFRSFLVQQQSDLAKSIRGLFPDRRTKVAEYRLRRRKDGSVAAQYDKHREKYSDVVDYTVEGLDGQPEEWYDCYELVPFNLGSPQQRIQRLTELGWEPTEFTKKGSPKVDEDALLRFSDESGRPEIKALAEYLVVSGRLSMLAGNPKTGSVGWLGAVQDDHRIHGRVMSCGATTRRMIHSVPNTANVPSPHKAKYGKEMRSFWGVAPGTGLSLVGYDAAGLETAGLCHYLNNPSATEVLLRDKPNDIHSANARRLTEALGRPIDREWGSKTCVPLDSKILTRRGWRAYDELIIGEEVLGYNQDTKCKEWTKLEGINVCEDEVFEFGNSYRKFRANAAHRWFVRQRKRGLKSWSKTDGQYMVDEVRTTEELNSESSIIINAPFNQTQDLVPSNGPDWIKDQKYGIDWAQRVLNMSHVERKQFLQGFLLADGHIVEGDHWAWSQNKNEIAEGLLLASYLVNDGQIHVAAKNGYNEDMYTVTLAKKSHVTCSKFEKKSLGIQTLWCPKTGLGSWVMRQGNEITITGNTWYAWLYGAYPAKLGQIVKGPPSDGEIVIETFYRNVPGLKELINDVQREWRTSSGRLVCIDGGSVICPSLSASLNYKIQSAGAIVMKLTSILLEEECRKHGLYMKRVLDVHDEGQLQCRTQDASVVGMLAVDCITRAGRELGFRVELTGDYKVGENWSMTH